MGIYNITAAVMDHALGISREDAVAKLESTSSTVRRLIIKQERLATS